MVEDGEGRLKKARAHPGLTSKFKDSSLDHVTVDIPISLNSNWFLHLPATIGLFPKTS